MSSLHVIAKNAESWKQWLRQEGRTNIFFIIFSALEDGLYETKQIGEKILTGIKKKGL